MNRSAVRLLYVLTLAWAFLASGLAAETQLEEPARSQPELDRPAVVAPQKKKSRHRPRTTPQSKNDRVEIGKDVLIAAGETVGELVVIAGNARIDGTVDGDL